MSIADSYAIKMLQRRFSDLEARVAAIENKANAIEQNIIEGDDVPRESISADLVEQYQNKFGKPPHHRMKLETIREALR